MQEIAGTLPLSRKENEGSKPQFPLKRLNLNKSLKKEKPRLPPKRKNNNNNIILSQLFMAPLPSQRRFG